MESEHVTELIPAYALGCLDEDETGQVERHLAECEICRAEAESYRRVGEQIALAAPLAAPPAALRAQLMARIAPPPDTSPEISPRPSLWQQIVAFSRRMAPVWTPVSLLLIVGLLVANTALWRASPQPPTAEVLTSVEMTGTDQAPEARGVLAAAGQTGVLVVYDLPPLDAAHQYQLWLIQDGQRTDGGVFSVDPLGFAQLRVQAPQSLLTYGSFGVTIEPAGGSPGPTGAKVMGGEF